MIIGLVLLGLIVALMFFGIAQRVFKSLGVAYPFAFLIVGALVASAFVPSFEVMGVTVSVAGFIVPLALSAVFFALAAKTRELSHSLVSASAVLAIYVAVGLLMPAVDPMLVSAVGGVLCGGTAYVVGKTRLAAVSGVFGGVPTGAAVCAIVGKVSTGGAVFLGSSAVFDAVIIAVVTAVVLYEIVAALRKNANVKRVAAAETAEEFDPDEYKKYFDE